jgi:hypothetical protein
VQAATVSLNEVLHRLQGMPEKDRLELEKKAKQLTADMPWIPNPGSQTEAFECQADEIAYGGEAGPGKTSMLVGRSLCKAKRSLVLRRTNNEARALVDEYEKVLGQKPKLDKNDSFRFNNRRIRIGGCQHEKDKQKYKGVPYDLLAFDQVEDFTESQYTFISQWCRSDDPTAKPQVVCSLNPPTNTQGVWVIRRWGAWIDPKHPRKAKDGEIRWFTTINGADTEVDGPGPHQIDGKPTMAKSRTFIRGRLEENVALAQSGYDATRAAAPKGMRAAYRDGNFEESLADAPNQVIPRAWVLAAQKRRRPKPTAGIPMCAIAADASGGGNDPLMIGWRHDGWFSDLVEVPGKDIPVGRIGAFTAGVIVSHRRDDAQIVIDMGGGYGGPAYEWLAANNVKAEAYKGAEKSTRRTADKKLGFVNKRSAAIWKFREALDPGQPGGSPIELPDDPVLLADLTSPTFEVTPHGIAVEAKEDVCERLGRSTDRGDTVVMLWWSGPKATTAALDWAGAGQSEQGRAGPGAAGRYPKVITGRQQAPRRRA